MTYVKLKNTVPNNPATLKINNAGTYLVVVSTHSENYLYLQN
jgi:hypothetical protein